MAEPKIPYPPSPPDVPEGLTDYADSYTKQQNLLLAGLFVFLIFYIGAVILFGMVSVWCFLTLAKWPIVKIIGLVFSLTFFLFLVKGFFKRHPMNKDMHIELTEDEHPVLFGFIHQLCEELGAPLPNKVYVSPDVNAAVMPRTSLINLFVEPKKDLLIGMGLVNCVNLSEFKAVLAHEFGHFSQSAMGSSYAYVATRIIGDLVDGEDWFDRLINWCKRQDNAVSIFGHVIGSCLWLGRKVLEWLYKVITLQRLAVSREREFHADKVAVSAAGSNAVVHCLLRTEFGHMCFMQAIDDLATALDHKLYTKDLYLHQDRASAVVRRKKKEPELGMPPILKGPSEGKEVHVFDADEEAMAEDIPPMWRTHPANSEREANAKEDFVAAIVDHRSPWILFNNPAELREDMSYKFYRMVFRIPKGAELADAQKVQEYIDNEYAETTYDPKYHGAYDDRPLEPGDLSELNTIIHDSPWTEERMQKVYDKLFEGCREHAEAHADLHKELASLRNNVVGKPSGKMKRMIEDTEKKLDENWEWFKSFDRRVYLLHVQMAAQVDMDTKNELVERYRFQVEVQRFYQEARHNFNKADAYIGAYGAAMRGEIKVPNDFGAEVIAVLRAAWKVLKKIIQDAREINLPAMKNFEEGERLADFILEGKMVPEPPLSELKGVWVQKLMTQLQGVKNRCFRLHFKSVGGILAMQEKVAAAWLAARAPVAAEVVEVVAAEVVPAEVVAAEVLPAEVVEPLPAEVVEEVVAAEVVPAEVVESLDALPAEVVQAEPTPAAPALAAFTATPSAAAPAQIIPPAPPVTPVSVVAEPMPLDAVEVLDAPVVEEPEPVFMPPMDLAPAAPVAKTEEVAKPEEPAKTETEAKAEPEAGTRPEAALVTPAAAESDHPFSLDADAPAPGAKAEQPAAKAEHPAEKLPESPVAEIFSLDLAAQSEPQEIFSLDADDDGEAEPPPAKAPPVVPKSQAAKPAPAPASDEVFSLDADELPPPAKPVAPVAQPVAQPAAKAVPAARPAPAKPASSTTVTPAARPAFGSSASMPALATNGNGKRPAVKITLVKPGEKSPFAK